MISSLITTWRGDALVAGRWNSLRAIEGFWGQFWQGRRRSMVKALRMHTVGGRHHPQLEEVALPHPGCNEVEVRHTAIGLNYPDVEDCTGGGHHGRHSIFTPGSSAVGVITELGTGVLDYRIGQRVGYVNPPHKGAFSEASVLPTSCLIPIPSNMYVTDDEAAALLFPGLTAWMLWKRLNPLRRGDAILVHNVVSGLGSIIAQWARHLEAFVIGAVTSEKHVQRAEASGCHEVVILEAGSCNAFVDQVREFTAGEGAAVVVDLVGKGTFMASLDCLAPKGVLISLGGDAPAVNFKDLAGRRSFSVSVPVWGDYVNHREELLEGSQLLFELYKAGDIKVEIANKFPLNRISEVLDAVTKGEVVGSCILNPPIPDPKNYYS